MGIEHMSHHDQGTVEKLSPKEDYIERLKNFRISQMESLYRDEAIDRRIRLVLPEIMRSLREGEDIDVADLFKRNPSVYVEASQTIKNEEVIRKIEKILASGVSEQDSLAGRMPTEKHLLSQYEQNSEAKIERGDSDELRRPRAALLEQEYNMLYAQSLQAKTDEQREAAYTRISNLATDYPDLWPDFLGYIHKSALRENGIDRFDYYEPMLARATVLTQKDSSRGLDFFETVELKHIVETLLWTRVIQAKRSGQVRLGSKEEILNFIMASVKANGWEEAIDTAGEESLVQRLRGETDEAEALRRARLWQEEKPAELPPQAAPVEEEDGKVVSISAARAKREQQQLREGMFKESA